MNPININPKIMNGTPVFTGTRVPVQSLFWHLAKGISIDEFLEDFPSVKKEQVLAVLNMASLSFQSTQSVKMYEDIAG